MDSGVLLDRSLRGLDVHKTISGSCGRSHARSLQNSHHGSGTYSYSYSSPYYSYANPSQLLQNLNSRNTGTWKSASPTAPSSSSLPPLYNSRTASFHNSFPSLLLNPLLLHQPPLLPLPPTTKYSTFPSPSTPPPFNNPDKTPCSNVGHKRHHDKRKPTRTPRREQTRAMQKKPLERARPLPPAPEVKEALDDFEQELARSFLHALAPPPSCVPLPSFCLVKSTKAAAASSCNAQAFERVGGNGTVVDMGATDGLRRLLRL